MSQAFAFPLAKCLLSYKLDFIDPPLWWNDTEEEAWLVKARNGGGSPWASMEIFIAEAGTDNSLHKLFDIWVTVESTFIYIPSVTSLAGAHLLMDG